MFGTATFPCTKGQEHAYAHVQLETMFREFELDFFFLGDPLETFKVEDILEKRCEIYVKLVYC